MSPNKITTDYTKQLSKYMADFDYVHIPEEVIERAKMLTLHTIGVSLASASLPQAQGALKCARSLNGGTGGTATVWLTGEKLSPAAAAFVNGTASDILDWEDCAWTGHPCAGVIPSALAVAQDRHRSGKDFLAAVVSGFECYLRVGMSVQPPADYDHGKGWGIVSWQIFASSMPAAKLMGFHESQFNQAIGVSCIYTPIPSNLLMGTMSNCYHYQQGMVNVSGILGCLNVEAGFDNLKDGLDIINGYSEKLTEEEKRYWLTKDLDKFLMMKILVKHWPANMWIQTPIELVYDMRQAYSIVPEDIQEIIIDPPTQYRMHFYEEGFSSLMDAQFSMPYCISTMFYGGKPGAEWFDEKLYTAPKIIDLARKVKPGPSAEDSLQTSFIQFQNGDYPMKKVTITMKDGTVYEGCMDKHKGHPDNMMNREEFCQLFMKNADCVLNSEQAEKLMNQILDIENINDLAEIFN